MVEAIKEVAKAVMWYKASMELEDEVREVVCDAFVKGFRSVRKRWHYSSTSPTCMTSSRSSPRGMRAT